LINNYKE